jgi:hypothetical protein
MMETSKANLQLIKPLSMGVISKVGFSAGTKIFEFRGDVLSTAQLSSRHPSDVVDFLQIGSDRWISKSGSFDDYISHNCNPTCYVRIVGSRAILTTLHAITPGMRIDFDWSTTSVERLDEWQMPCKCGYIRCRKVISGIQSVPKEIAQAYKAAGILPSYVLSYLQS